MKYAVMFMHDDEGQFPPLYLSSVTKVRDGHPDLVGFVRTQDGAMLFDSEDAADHVAHKLLLDPKIGFAQSHQIVTH